MTERFEWPGRRAGDEGHDRLAAFLRMDIQSSPEWAQDLCDQIDAVMAGRAAEWTRSGNAYFLKITAAGAEIDDAVIDEDEPIRVPLADLKAAASAWRAAIQG